MQCENIFCIYWNKDGCILREVSLDVMGCCQNCIYVDIKEETLQAEREKLLNQD